MLDRLLEDLGHPDAPGVQGFRDLHEVRNQVQHRGILPATDQVPRWLQETEDLIAFLVHACFGVELADVGSASSVADEKLRRTLGEAEEFLDAGEAKESMARSWETLESARVLLRRRTGLRTGERPLTSRPSDRQGEEIRKQFQALSDQLEVSLFTAEPGEWMWFQQRYQDSQNGLPASAEDARRAFVFVLAWVLRVEGYIARHGPERWEQWQELRAPRTGLPGGPHIQDAWHGRKFPNEGAWEWGFQLTDLPDDFNPDFTWGIQAAQEASKDPLVLYAYLDMTGKLFIRVPEKSAPEQVVEAARGLVAEAKQQMADRAVADQQQFEYEEGLIEPFRIALDKAGCPYKQILAKDATFRGGRAGGPPLVWIELAGVGPHGTTRFPRFLEESFAPSSQILTQNWSVLDSTTSPFPRAGSQTPWSNGCWTEKRKTGNGTQRELPTSRSANGMRKRLCPQSGGS